MNFKIMIQKLLFGKLYCYRSLILQSKWHVEKRNLCPRDIVLVQDTKALRGKWKLAEVHSVKSNDDGKVRDVTLRYKYQDDNIKYTGLKDVFINRSVHRLVVIIPAEERQISNIWIFELIEIEENVGKCIAWIDARNNSDLLLLPSIGYMRINYVFIHKYPW